MGRIAWAALLIIVECVTFVVLFLVLHHNLSIKKDKISKAEKTIISGEASSAKTQSLVFKKKKLQQYVESVRLLELGMEQMGALFVHVAKVVPKQAWLTNFNKKGENITIEGFGMTNEIIGNFANNLYDYSIFNNLGLKYTEKSKILDNFVYKFQFIGTLREDAGSSIEN